MRRRTWLTCLALAAATTTSLPATAQQRAAASDAQVPTDDQRKAQEHFQRAKELYLTGKYSEAIADLEIARNLDPKAKDLVMNLGIVYEKLGKYDEALSELKRYLDMDGVTPAERTKAEGMIKRIEGAKEANEQPPPKPEQPPPSPPNGASSAPSPPGRIDALTIAAGAVAVAGLGAGTAVGIYALGARPKNGFVTGRDGSYATLQDKTDGAHTAAVVADVCFGVGVVAAVATAWLYLGRPKDASAPTTGTSKSRVSVAPSAGPNGGGVVVGGAF